MLFFDPTLLMTDLFEGHLSPIGYQTWQRCHTKSHTEKRFGGQHAQIFFTILINS